MRLRLPPLQAFPHEISYIAKGEEDDWGKPTYAEPIILYHTRVDEGYNFSRGGLNASNDMPNSLIVIFKDYNPVLPVFENQNLIVFNNKEFTITKVIPLYFMTDEVIGYELEVK